MVFHEHTPESCNAHVSNLDLPVPNCRNSVIRNPKWHGTAAFPQHVMALSVVPNKKANL